MDSEKSVSAAYIALAVAILLGFVSMMMQTFGGAEYDIYSIAADSSGRVYVGKPEVIEVWEQGEQIGEINPQTGRGYYFTVCADDTILVAVSSTVYHLTLDGVVIESWEEPGLDTHYQLQWNRKHHTSPNGDEYVLKQSLWWPKIVKNGEETVYQLSSVAFYARIMTYLSAAVLLICVPFLIVCKIHEKIKYGW